MLMPGLICDSIIITIRLITTHDVIIAQINFNLMPKLFRRTENETFAIVLTGRTEALNNVSRSLLEQCSVGES